MRRSGRRDARWLIGILLTLAATVAIAALYEQTRPRLARRSESQRLQHAYAVAQSSWYEEPRAVVACVREFALDYPKVTEPSLRLLLARGVAYWPEGDEEIVANEVERVAAGVLGRHQSGDSSLAQEFARIGLLGGTYDTVPGWPRPFLMADVDGDGRQDVVLAFPGGMSRSVCCLFRSTPRGWVRYRLGTGVPVIGLWSFNITRKGPRAILMASLADSEYRPNLWIDLFVWQHGRMNNVLSTWIPHGWQWEHRDLVGDGVEALRLYGHDTAEHLWNAPPRHTLTYRWNGDRFILQATARKGRSADPEDWLAEAEGLFDSGSYADAARVLEAAARSQRPPKQEDSHFDDWGGRLRCWYLLGLCRALQGRRAEALAAMRAAANTAGVEARDGGMIRGRAERFLAAADQPPGLSGALAAVGQLFRVLEIAQQEGGPDATPRGLLASVGIRPDFYQEVDLTGDGRPEALLRFHWPGGSAVTAWRQTVPGSPWTMWLLGYGLRDRPAPDYLLPADVLFYLPQAPALQPDPAPDEVWVRPVTRTSSSPPAVVIQYRQGIHRGERTVRWDGEQFVAASLPEAGGVSLAVELNRIEEGLFTRRAYRQILRQLAEFEQRVIDSRLRSEDKTDLLLEAYYHEALCYRELGRSREAVNRYWALWRRQPDRTWGMLAQHWLQF